MNQSARTVPLAAQLRRAALELAGEPAPPALAERIRATLRSKARRRSGWRTWTAWTAGSALGGACAALLAAIFWADAPAASGTSLASAGFVAVAGSEDWREAAKRGGTAWLVATEMPQAKLAALGLPYDPARAGDSVRAQLLIHSSGDVLAVRVIR